MFEHPFAQFAITGFAIMAFIIAIKVLSSYLPDSNTISATVKKVINIA